MPFDRSEYDNDDLKNVKSLGQRNGVDISSFDFSDSSFAARSYGGVLKYNLFYAGQTIEHDFDVPLYTQYAVSVGNATGSVPTGGSASWSGAMAGIDENSGEFLLGDAMLAADFGSKEIDANFTNVRQVSNSAGKPDISFEDVPMSGDGFSSDTVGNRILGAFYGAEHAEVGGVFQSGTINGSFGASRQ